jgi:hypothetical protein
MDTQHPSFEQEQKALQTHITALRAALAPYLHERGRNFSSEQLVELMVAAPVALAIAFDGEIDSFELEVLAHSVRFAHRFFEEQLNEESQAFFRNLAEPDERVRSHDFPQILQEELMFLIKNYPTWKNLWTDALRTFLEMETWIQKHNPMLKPIRKTVVEAMYVIYLKNKGNNEEEEQHLHAILQGIGIDVEGDYIKSLIQSFSA